MYTKFNISNFRGVKKLSLDSLTRINLITGQNNVGKTSLLEAIFVHAGGHNPDLTMVINGLRGLDKVSVDFDRLTNTPWDSIFFDFDSTGVIRLSGEFEEDYRDIQFKVVRDLTEISGLRLSVRETYARMATSSERAAMVLRMEVRYEKDYLIRKSKSKKFDPAAIKPQKFFLVIDKDGKHIEPTPPRAPFPAKLNLGRSRESVDHEARRFAQLQIQGKDELLLKALQVLEPRLNNLSVVYESGEPLLQGDIGIKKRHFIPLAVMGDGMNRLATLILLIGNTENGVLLLDEIDTGIHYSVMSKVWGAIMQAAQDFNVQIFCTTHSRECALTAHTAALSYIEYPLSLHRLERRDGNVDAISYDKTSIQASIDSDFEIR